MRRACCLVVPLLAACSSEPSAPAVGRVGPAGGSVRAGEVVVTVPAGALTSEVEVTVRCGEAAPPGYEARSPVCRFGPDGQRFAAPVSVRLPVTGDTAGASVWWSREAAEGYDALPTTFAAGSATALVTHFSTGFVGALARGDGGLDAALDGAPDAADATSEASGDAADGADAAAADADATAGDAPGDVAPDGPRDALADVAMDAPTGTAPAPRPVYPLTGARSLSNRPQVRWALPAGVTMARLEFCRDRAMTVGCVTTVVAADRGAPSTALAAGTWYWALRGVAGGVAGAARSAVWRLRVPTATGRAQGFWGAEYDANGDGYADLVAPNYGTTTLDVLLGGPGGASLARIARAPQPITGLVRWNPSAHGDFNGDGYGDAAFVSDRGDLHVLRGSATGPAAPLVEVVRALTMSTSVSLSASDANGDGADDLHVGTTADSNGAWLPGGPSGLSASGLRTAFHRVIAAGDVDGDGFNDLVVAGAGIAWSLVRGAAGAPGFGSPVALGGTGLPVGDSNNDGFADVLVGDALRYGSAVGLGPETASSPRAALPLVGVAADIDQDGDDDVFGAAGDRVRVLLGDPGGRVELREALGDDPANPPQITGDMSGDGYVDLWRIRGVRNGPVDLAEFGPPMAARLVARDERQVAVVNVGDANGDGRADVVVGAGPTETAARFFAGAAGGFAPAVPLAVPAAASATHVAATGDLDRDGLADFALSLGPSAVRLVFGARSGLGARTRDLAGPPATAGAAVPVPVGDVDGDGHRDLVVVPPSGARVLLFRGSPSGPSATSTDVTVSASWRANSVDAAAAVGDLNGDRLADLVLQISSGAATSGVATVIFHGSPSGLVQAAAMEVNAAARFGSMAGPLGDIDGDGRDEAVVFGRVLDGVTVGGAPFGEETYLVAPAGDYDGDGVGDALVYGSGPAGTGIEVRAGTRGSVSFTRVLQRWPQYLAGGALVTLYPQPLAVVPDLDGDRRPEVVIDSLDGVYLLLTVRRTLTGTWLAVP